jgi:hypothetical protein
VTFRHSANRDITIGNINFWTFTPVWYNSGNTPTRDMENHISLKVLENEVARDWDFPDLWAAAIPEEDRVATPLAVAPKGTTDGQGLSATVEVIDEVIAGTRFLYFWGWASYNDAFHGTARHVTRFAVRIFIGGNPRDPNRISFSYSFLRRYNCSDEECTRQGYPADWTPRTLIVRT